MPGPVFPKRFVFPSELFFFSQVFAVLTCPCCGIFMTHGLWDNQHSAPKKKRQRWWRRLNELKPKPGGFFYGFLKLHDIFKISGDGPKVLFCSLFALPVSYCLGICDPANDAARHEEAGPCCRS